MKKIIIGIISGVLVLIISLLIFYNISLNKVSKNSEIVEFNVLEGSGVSSILSDLKKSNLIKNPLTAKIYLKLTNKTKIQAGTYELNRNMDFKEIADILNTGKTIDNSLTVTFIEGKRISSYAGVIANNFNYTEEEVLEVLNDKEYLESLIDKYWFIDKDILNKDIYYPLEGYVFPDTYKIKKDASIKEIIEILLDTMSKKLEIYQEQIENSNLSIHELLTLASIVELEGVNKDDRKGVASVFYNRLKSNWTLGSDVTTYYAEQKDFSEELTLAAYNSCNPYNTRGSCFTGLPVGPICSVGIESIDAVMNPLATDNYYFVADKNKVTYFAKTASEFNELINRLKRENLWYNY